MHEQTEGPHTRTWDDLADWWRSEIVDDIVYRTDVFPMYEALTAHMSGTVLDLGCGDGQAMSRTGSSTIGVDSSVELLRHAAHHGNVVKANLPDLSMFRTGSIDHAGSIYLVDLIDDDVGFFHSVARVVKPGGSLAIVMNHPVYTAPGSAPISDADGEVLWRWGAYPVPGSTEEFAGDRTVTFYHRPLGQLLNHAAVQGWRLDRLQERALSHEVIDEIPGYVGQDTIPRLLGARWTRDA